VNFLLGKQQGMARDDGGGGALRGVIKKGGGVGVAGKGGGGDQGELGGMGAMRSTWACHGALIGNGKGIGVHWVFFIVVKGNDDGGTWANGG